MKQNLINEVTSEYTSIKHPQFRVGDIIEVHTKIKEGGKKKKENEKEKDTERERIQIFKGIVIAKKGSGVSKTFTVRKISYGVGVEKIFPLYSPNISKIKVIKRSKKIRRSKLYFLRKRVGKQALKAGIVVPAEGEDIETEVEIKTGNESENLNQSSVQDTIKNKELKDEVPQTESNKETESDTNKNDESKGKSEEK